MKIDLDDSFACTKRVRCLNILQEKEYLTRFHSQYILFVSCHPRACLMLFYSACYTLIGDLFLFVDQVFFPLFGVLMTWVT